MREMFPPLTQKMWQIAKMLQIDQDDENGKDEDNKKGDDNNGQHDRGHKNTPALPKLAF